MKLLLYAQLNPRKPFRQLVADRDVCRLLFVLAMLIDLFL